MFLHSENQQLLWQTLQKSQYLVELTQKFPGYSEVWFRGISEQFYTQLITNNQRLPSTAQELLETNKHAILFMVADMKKILEYGKQENTWYSDITTYSSDSMRFPETRRQLGELNEKRFVKYQSEYNRLLETPKVPNPNLPSEEIDSKITNMEELVKDHIKRREMDLSTFSTTTQSTTNKPLAKLRILDELDNTAINIEDVGEEGNKKKTVHWPDEPTVASHPFC